jgi:single-strand DNA-binding protein
MSLNHVFLQGRLVRDVELRSTQSGTSVATLTIAVDRDYARDGASDKTDFVNVVCWKQTAEFASRYMSKGSMVVVSGRLESRKWEDKSGNKRTEWEVVADRLYFGESKRNNDNNSYQPPTGNPNVSAADFEDLEDDAGGELPFDLG